jgi:hypothetical protein
MMGLIDTAMPSNKPTKYMELFRRTKKKRRKLMTQDIQKEDKLEAASYFRK